MRVRDVVSVSGLLQYVVEKHAQTLLPHFLGMYRTTVNDQETYLLVMRNVFSPRLVIHKKYDLKVRSCQDFETCLFRNDINLVSSTVM